MYKVTPKKNLGQHFLKDKNIAEKIVKSLNFSSENKINCIEIGPGTGVLSNFLIQRDDINLHLVEIDSESVDYLKNNLNIEDNKIISADFLKMDLQKFSNPDLLIIGNFPYNISSQIFFKVLENKNFIPQIVCMLQKEVAERIAAKHGNKTYGILSVLLQTFYEIEYLFTVNENVFIPPPKVKSGVIRLTKRKEIINIDDEKTFFKLIKTSFAHRRKTMRNNLKNIFQVSEIEDDILNKRAEQISVSEFIDLSNFIYKNSNYTKI